MSPYVLVDRDEDYGLSVSCFRTEEEAQAAFTKRYNELMKDGVEFRQDALEYYVAYQERGDYRLEILLSDTNI